MMQAKPAAEVDYSAKSKEDALMLERGFDDMNHKALFTQLKATAHKWLRDDPHSFNDLLEFVAGGIASHETPFSLAELHSMSYAVSQLNTALLHRCSMLSKRDGSPGPGAGFPAAPTVGEEAPDRKRRAVSYGDNVSRVVASNASSANAQSGSMGPCRLLQLPRDVLLGLFAFLDRRDSDRHCRPLCSAFADLADRHVSWRHLDLETQCDPTRKATLLRRLCSVKTRPEHLALRLGQREFAILRRLMERMDVAQLRKVDIRLSNFGYLCDLAYPDVDDACAKNAIARLKRAGLLRPDPVSPCACVNSHAPMIITALNQLPVLEDLTLFAPWSMEGPLGRPSRQLFCVTSLRQMQLRPLKKLKCTVHGPEVEEMLRGLPLLQEFEIFGGGFDKTIRLVSPSLEVVSMESAEKSLWVEHIDCPNLRMLRARGSFYGNGFLRVRKGFPFGERWVNEEGWDHPAVFTLDTGYRLAYEKEVTFADEPRVRAITFGPSGPPAPECVFELTDDHIWESEDDI